MTPALHEQIGLGGRELVAIVGAGGKSTILFTLGRELAAAGGRIVLTTTTMMADDQVDEPICWSADTRDVDAALEPGEPLFVVTGRAPGKVTGPSIEAVDRLFEASAADHVIVEADGARSMSIKAPADHEPAIPNAATTVLVVMAADAIGRPMGEVAHRPERVAAISGLAAHDPMTADAAARVLLHPGGGMKSIPEGARVVMVVTRVTPANEEAADRVAVLLRDDPSVDRVVLIASTRR